MTSLQVVESFNRLGLEQEYLVFGSGQAARRTLYICTKLNIPVRAVVSDSTCNFAGLDVIRENELRQGDSVLLASDYAEAICDRLTKFTGVLIYDVTKAVQIYFEQHLDHLRGLPSTFQSPFKLDLYRTLLETLLKATAKSDYSDRTAPPTGLRWYARHDIDTESCVRNFSTMVDLELQLGLKVDTFIRVDALDYDPSSMISIVNCYMQKGVEFGLHTSCYLHQDYKAALFHELNTFKSHFGFAPKGVTFHGLGDLCRDRRDQAVHFLAISYKDLGFDYADVPGAQLHWHYVLQDCNLTGDGGRRQLDLAWLEAEFFSGKPLDVLILTHPCYWEL